MTFRRDLAWQQLELIYRSSVSHQFARYALALSYPLLPESVVHQAKRCVLDALGCAIGAYEAPGRSICEAVVKEIGGPQEATVFCSGLRTSALNAALVNSFLVRFLDYNDVGGGLHNSDCLPSILAICEREKAGGKDFLTSLVVSYELGARFKDSLSSSLEDKGWTGDTRAGLNVPPALGRLMRLTEDQIANAIGVCTSHALPLGILDSHRDENVMAKNLRFGWAAYDAILACMLAKKGFTGPLRVVESDVGFRKVIAQGDMDLERLTDFSGWRTLDVRFKSMAANATTHGHVFATMAIVKEQNLKPEDIAAVRIKAPVRESRHTTTPSKKYPRNAESADHSAFYANAIAIKEREFGPDSVKTEKFTDPVVLDLIEKITVEADPSMNRYEGSSEIITKDGRKFQKRIDVPHGLGSDPLTDKELEEKFSEMANKYMSKEQIKKICNNCGKCAAVCPTQAIELLGKSMSVDDVVKIAEEDDVFYWQSGGGITVSGGEPLSQSGFVGNLLKRCRERGIDTAVETSGYGNWEDLQNICRYADLIFYDIKCMDSTKHKASTGVTNGLILENIKKLSSYFPETPIIVRTPIIPGFNDSEEDVRAIVGFLTEVRSLREYELQPYHRLGEAKYHQMGKQYRLDGLRPPSEEDMARLRQAARLERLDPKSLDKTS